MKLSNTEEQLMNHLWKLEKTFFKDLVNELPEPKPASTTINTLLKRMIDKGFVAYKLYGNSREYYPIVKKDDYFAKKVKGMISNFFNDSASQFASFFTKETELNQSELKEIRKIIDEQIKRNE